MTAHPLRERIALQFNALADGIGSAFDLARPAPALRCNVLEEPTLSARVRRARQGYVIELGQGFLEELHAGIGALPDRALADTLGAMAPARRRKVPPPAALRQALATLAEQFLLQHEVAHVLCGHLETAAPPEQAAGRPTARRALPEPATLLLDEVSIGADIARAERSRASRTAVRAVRRSMYRELEADGTALQSIALHAVVGDLALLLGASGLKTPELAVAEVPEPHRALAFRLVLAAAGQVALLMARRSAGGSNTHPYPATRLFGLVFALLEHYPTLDDVREDRRGRRTTVLDAQSAAQMQSFFMEVVRPTLRLMLLQVDEQAVLARHGRVSPDQSDLLADLLLDLKAVLFGEPARSVGARQFEIMLRHRAAFDRQTRPLRYLSDVR